MSFESCLQACLGNFSKSQSLKFLKFPEPSYRERADTKNRNSLRSSKSQSLFGEGSKFFQFPGPLHREEGIYHDEQLASLF